MSVPASAEGDSAEAFVSGAVSGCPSSGAAGSPAAARSAGTLFPGSASGVSCPAAPAGPCGGGCRAGTVRPAEGVPPSAAARSAGPGLSASSSLSPEESFPGGPVLSDADAATPPAFADFALGVYPFLDLKPFHRAYYRVLEAFAAGRVRRLIVTMPPQHGKSVGATTLLPAYVLGLDPDCRVAIASYSGALASKFNRRVQRILESREYAAFFPATTIKRGARPPGYIRTADEVEVVGRRGGLLSVGREGSLTGNRVDCFILDDLYRKKSKLSQTN